jgi:hypothetical protein
MSAKNEPLGVTRFNYPKSKLFGWMARISRNGKRRSEFFADAIFGGSRAAKAAALKLHAEWIKELGPSHTSHQGVKTKRNRSGIVNVYTRIYVPKDQPHLEYYFSVGTWKQSNGKRKSRSFSWNRYTEAVAIELAIIARDLRSRDAELIRAEYRKRHGHDAPELSEQ